LALKSDPWPVQKNGSKTWTGELLDTLDVCLCVGVQDGAVVCCGPARLYQAVRPLAARVMSTGAAAEGRQRGEGHLHLLQGDLQQFRSLDANVPDRTDSQGI